MTQADLENSKLEQIASEYRRKGYDVVIRPPEDHIPAFLRPFQPDLVAMSDGGNVVVEIKSSPELASDQSSSWPKRWRRSRGGGSSSSW